MKTLLVLGAGRSSGSLIQYLLKHAPADGYCVRVGDFSEAAAAARINNDPAGVAFAFNIEDEQQRAKEISGADLVISLLPPALHILAAHACLNYSKNLITASYISQELMHLDEEVRSKGLLFMNECGLDPGIDHMSAMEIIHRLKDQGAELLAFRSYTGGLVAPESNDNPWGYKFTWNPRNVILAGQGTARFIRNGHYHYLPYSRLFRDIVRIEVGGLGKFDGYANRDSLAYRKHYGLDQIPTLLRGTLRQEGYCAAWDVFVQLGLTDDSYQIEDAGKLTYAQLVKAFLPEETTGDSIADKLASFCGLRTDDTVMHMIRYTGILDDKIIPLEKASPAQILQQLLEQKWVLKPGDKDMIVMQHQFEYKLKGVSKKLVSSLVVKGDDTIQTAMAKTVGLPLGITARLMFNNRINCKGVQLPVQQEVYVPVLEELKTMGISFQESAE